jgi:hypothetical protein
MNDLLQENGWCGHIWWRWKPGWLACRRTTLVRPARGDIARYRRSSNWRWQEFNQALVAFTANLEQLAQGLNERERMDSRREKLEIGTIHRSDAKRFRTSCWLPSLAGRARSASPAEHEVVCNIWAAQRAPGARWDQVKADDQAGRPTEMRLDDMALALVEWLNTEYKILPESWKDPKVTFKAFDGDTTIQQLWFYVDNIRLSTTGACNAHGYRPADQDGALGWDTEARFSAVDHHYLVGIGRGY